MGFVKQVGDSDCYNACIASLTGIDLVEFPVLDQETYEAMSREDRGNAGVRQHNECLEVLRKYGWTFRHAYAEAPKGWSIGDGKSPRGDWGHSVLCWDGVPKFDPHQSNAMLDGDPNNFMEVLKLSDPRAGT